MHFLPRHIALLISVFLVGFIVMVTELASVRLFSPYLGSSIYVWTNVIGVVMAGLALGYYLGGRLADKTPSATTLSYVLLGAAIAVIYAGMGGSFILEFFSRSSLNIQLASLFSAILVMGPMNMLLGMVTPFVTKISLNDSQTPGRTIGSVYALSTLGSIAGTFIAGFVLIPYIGVHDLFLLSGAVLVVCAFVLGGMATFTATSIVAGFIAAFFLAPLETLFTRSIALLHDAELVADINTPYNRILVEDHWSDTYERVVRTYAGAQSSVFRDQEEGTYETYLPYAKVMQDVTHFIPDAQNVLLIGGAGYGIPQYFSHAHPDIHLTVVEIDPESLPIAREYFGFTPYENFTNVVADGRSFLHETDEKWDAVLLDAFNQNAAHPFELTTQEFFSEVASALTPKGMVVMNIISSVSGDNNTLLRAQYTTLSSVFPHVYVFPLHSPEESDAMQNIIVIATNEPLSETALRPKGPLSEFLAMRLDEHSIVPSLILRDDFAPVEYFYWGYNPCLLRACS